MNPKIKVVILLNGMEIICELAPPGLVEPRPNKTVPVVRPFILFAGENNQLQLRPYVPYVWVGVDPGSPSAVVHFSESAVSMVADVDDQMAKSYSEGLNHLAAMVAAQEAATIRDAEIVSQGHDGADEEATPPSTH